MIYRKLHSLSILVCLILGFQNISIASEEFIEHQIKSGDSLWKLCQQFKQAPESCWETLADLNKISKPQHLTPDRTIIIPASWAPNKPTVALVLYKKGTVQYFQYNNDTKNHNSPVALKKHTYLQQEDRLTTGENSSALLLFKDQSEMYVRENSDLNLTKLNHDPIDNKTQSEILLIKGKISSLVNPNKKKSTFEIITPFAVAAVRGTEFRVSSNITTSTSEVLEGLVEMNAQEKSISLPEGFASIVKEGETPSDPIKLLDPPLFKEGVKVGAENRALIRWSSLNKAVAYQLDLLKKTDNKYLILETKQISKNNFTTSKLRAGSYQIDLRGIDKNELYGLDASINFEISEIEIQNKRCRKIFHKHMKKLCR